MFRVDNDLRVRPTRIVTICHRNIIRHRGDLIVVLSATRKRPQQHDNPICVSLHHGSFRLFGAVRTREIENQI